mmetsp:Transcript_20788/g.32586  ORF Transcript_20788/g.32586 Transcript_20788/m.32586 type:complete len:215 (-) Transcript_20788:31-675(-)
MFALSKLLTQHAVQCQFMKNSRSCHRNLSEFVKVAGFSRYSIKEDVLDFLGPGIEKDVKDLQLCVNSAKYADGEWLVEVSSEEISKKITELVNKSDRHRMTKVPAPKVADVLTSTKIGAGPDTLRLVNIPTNTRIEEIKWHFRFFEVESVEPLELKNRVGKSLPHYLIKFSSFEEAQRALRERNSRPFQHYTGGRGAMGSKQEKTTLFLKPYPA